jgi:hypothetical protein
VALEPEQHVELLGGDDRLPGEEFGDGRRRGGVDVHDRHE